MNRRRILGIVFVIAALVCLHGFSTAMSREDGHTTKTMEQIEKAVFLQNGKVDKENEGKPVIVRGKLHTAKEAHDTQMDLTLNSPYVERKMEVMGEDGKWTEDEEGSVAFFGKATLGEFKLSKDFLKDIKLTKGYTDFSESELGDDLTVKDKYVYESDSKRYLYSYIPDRKELTLVGTQEGKTLQEIRGIECVREGSLSKADLKTDEDELNLPYVIGSAALAAIFIVLACWMLGLFSKRKKEEEEEDPSIIEEEWPQEDIGKDSVDLWLDEEMAENTEKPDPEPESELEKQMEKTNDDKLLDDLEMLRKELEQSRKPYEEEQQDQETEEKKDLPVFYAKDLSGSDEVTEPEMPEELEEETEPSEAPEPEIQEEETGHEEDEIPEEPETEAEPEKDQESAMLTILQDNWAAKQQKRKTSQTGSLKQRSRKQKQPQKNSGKSAKKKQARRRR